MGIRRLTQDLEEYAEPAVLSNDIKITKDHVQVSKVVIDGPSLIYYVYDDLMKQMTAAEIAAALVPSYAKVADGVKSVIEDLESRGVEIEAMLFDGNLPDSKRGTRMERMEMSRQKLENFRNVHSGLGRYPTKVDNGSVGANAWERRDRSVMNTPSLLPHPPFLSSAVMEAVMIQGHTFNIELVPEEADVACARMAQVSGAAILTNDSDLAMYDLGSDGCVLWLRTLTSQRLQTASPTSNSVLKDAHKTPNSRLVCSCARPAEISKRLRIPSFLVYGFERYMDSNASSSIIQTRARDQSRRDYQPQQFEEFKKQFEVTPYPLELAFILQLDPRLSEFAIDALEKTITGEPPSIYLGILHEDPSRESSWTCGATYRKLAYSLFYLFQQKESPAHVVEHTRRGSHVASVSLLLLNSQQINSTAKVMLHKLRTRLLGLLQPPENDIAMSEQTATALPEIETITEWYSLALCTVLQHKVDSGKPPFSYGDVDRLFGFEDPLSSTTGLAATFKPKWNDLHLLANIQAVLYSWRMLKQILDWAYVLEHGKISARDGLDVTMKSERLVPSEVWHLKEWLNDMPIASELFLDLRSLRTLSLDMRSVGNGRERGMSVEMVEKMLEPYLGPRKKESETNGSLRKRKKDKMKRRDKVGEEGKNHRPKSRVLEGNAFSVLSSGDMDD